MVMSALAGLEQPSSLSQKISIVHQALSERFAFLAHISVAIYDPQTDLLRTLLDSTENHPVLTNYQARLATVPRLQKIVQTGRPQVVDDLSDFSNSSKEHTQRILACGFRSSYTMPIFLDGVFYGFVFFNALQPKCFQPDVVAHLDPFGRLLALLVVSEIRSIRKLTAATKTMHHITARRDCETGAHLERMARFSQLMARELASEFDLTDEYIEHLFLFAPMHDIGKIAIPDSILLKPGKLNHKELDIMRTHTEKGLEMIDYMLQEFELESLMHVEILRNIVYCHHEWVDGSGYPQGLKGDAIPLEARIVATTDIFDALTSWRPYKKAWSNEQAFNELRALAGVKVDNRCIDVLWQNRDEVEALQRKFQETSFG